MEKENFKFLNDVFLVTKLCLMRDSRIVCTGSDAWATTRDIQVDKRRALETTEQTLLIGPACLW